MDRLDEIKARAAAATPGPWFWDMSKLGHQVMLKTTHSGQYYVMGFERWGMRGATPIFQEYENYSGESMKDRKSQGMKNADYFKRPRKEYKPDFECDINHPDAQLMAYAPSDIRWLIGEVERLRSELKARE